jgi:hypothetical protein
MGPKTNRLRKPKIQSVDKTKVLKASGVPYETTPLSILVRSVSHLSMQDQLAFLLELALILRRSQKQINAKPSKMATGMGPIPGPTSEAKMS